MDLQILAISDTHLGEDTSILTFPQGRQFLWRTLREIFGEKDLNAADGINKKFNIEELILVGDIPDTALSSRSQIITHTNAFIATLGSAANVKKGVYVPGNHDHTLWSDYLNRKKKIQSCDYCTPSEGEFLVVDNSEIKADLPFSKDLLSIFFGYPSGSSWRKILLGKKDKAKNFNFVIANPIYTTQSDKRTYVFAHGTHFKKSVIERDTYTQIIKTLGLNRILVTFKDEPEPNQNFIMPPGIFSNLEKTITSFVETIWASSGNLPTSRADHLWNIFTMLRGKFEKNHHIFDKSKRFSNDYLQKLRARTLKVKNWIKESKGRKGRKRRKTVLIERIKILFDEEYESLDLFKTHFLNTILTLLDDQNLLEKPLTFIYGDTHDGGYGEMETEFKGNKIDLRIYNCGSWVVHGDNHPPCHIFAVDMEGNEYLLDLSIIGERVLNVSLLKLAGRDYENRIYLTTKLFEVIMEHFSKLPIYSALKRLINFFIK